MEIDRPDVIAEVAVLFEAYEQALVNNDVARILGFFAADAVRFGIADQQTGLTEQRQWRLAQPALPPGRWLKDTTIVAYGRDVAVVTTSFGYPGSDAIGRQSQTWVRLPQGWRIVTAHVSLPARPGEAVPTAPAAGPAVEDAGTRDCCGTPAESGPSGPVHPSIRAERRRSERTGAAPDRAVSTAPGSSRCRPRDGPP